MRLHRLLQGIVEGYHTYIFPIKISLVVSKIQIGIGAKTQRSLQKGWHFVCNLEMPSMPTPARVSQIRWFKTIEFSLNCIYLLIAQVYDGSLEFFLIGWKIIYDYVSDLCTYLGTTGIPKFKFKCTHTPHTDRQRLDILFLPILVRHLLGLFA